MAQIDAAGISSVFAPITIELATLGSRATLYVPSFDMSGSDGPNVGPVEPPAAGAVDCGAVV